MTALYVKPFVQERVNCWNSIMAMELGLLSIDKTALLLKDAKNKRKTWKLPHFLILSMNYLSRCRE